VKARDRIINALKQSFVSQLLSIANQIVLIPIYLYFWGVEKYGIWLTIIAFSQWFSLIDFGVGHYLPNKLTVLKNRNKLKQYNLVLGTFISVNIVLSVIFMIIGLLFAYIISKNKIIDVSDMVTNFELIVTLTIFIALNIFQSITNFSPIVYVSSNKYYMPSLRRNQRTILNLIFIPLSLYMDVSFVGVVSIIFLTEIVVEIVSIKDVINNYKFANLKLLKLRWGIIRKYYSGGIWFMGAKLYDINYQSIPIILIQYYISPAAVVLFTLHRTVANIVMQIKTVTTNVIWRESTILFADKNIEMLRDMYLFIQKSSLYFMILAASLLFIYGEEIFSLWLHKDGLFDPSLLVLMLLVVLVQTTWGSAEVFLLSWNDAKSVVRVKMIYIVLLLLLSISIFKEYSNLYYFIILNILLNIFILSFLIVNKLHKELGVNNTKYIQRILFPFSIFIAIVLLMFFLLDEHDLMLTVLMLFMLLMMILDVKRTESVFVNILIAKEIGGK